MIQCRISDSDNPMDQLVDCLNIINQLEEEATKKNIIFDMSNISWLSPFAALVLSSKIVQSGKNLEIKTPKNESVSSYLSAIGFPLGRKYVGMSYCPIHHFTENPSLVASNVCEVIDKNFPDILKGDAIKYIISELCDNIEQHSKFTHASIMAQYYKKKEFVDIGVVDNGITIPGLFEKKRISFKDDYIAIDMALSGVSTKEEIGRGKGLFSTKKIVEAGLKGEFYIISRHGGLSIDSDDCSIS